MSAAPAGPRPAPEWGGRLGVAAMVARLVLLVTPFGSLPLVVVDERLGLLLPIAAVAVVGGIAGALLSAAVVPTPRPTLLVAIAVPMGLLAGLAPVGALLLFRLSFRACGGLNLLALPWAEPWRTTGLIGSAIVVVVSTTMLLIATRVRLLRPSAIALWIWSAAAVVPVFLVALLMIYGDAPLHCVPV